MKPESISNTNFQAIPVTSDRESSKNQSFDSPLSFQDFTVPQSMTQQEVEPPPYIWDRIVSVLDAQDRLKELTQVAPATPVSASAEQKVSPNNRLILYAAVAMLVGAIILSVV